nr:synaptogyrin-4 [Vulpes vulpes]
MHIPESLQDLADSEAVQFMKRPKTITRIFAGVRPSYGADCPMVLWIGIWFVGFCFLANQWQHSPPKGFLLGSSSAKAAITFAFFSIFTWIFQAYLALQDLRNDTPVPYKRSLDEGGVVLTTLSPPSATSPVNTPTTGPNNLSYAGSAPSPYLTTPKAPRLAMMPDN